MPLIERLFKFPVQVGRNVVYHGRSYFQVVFIGTQPFNNKMAPKMMYRISKVITKPWKLAAAISVTDSPQNKKAISAVREKAIGMVILAEILNPTSMTAVIKM